MESIQIIERAVGISYDGEWFRFKKTLQKDICILPKGEQNFTLRPNSPASLTDP